MNTHLKLIQIIQIYSTGLLKRTAEDLYEDDGYQNQKGISSLLLEKLAKKVSV